MKRAINSVGLNSGEGLCARGGNRTVRIESAMASGREVDTLDRIVATLYKLAYRPLIRRAAGLAPAALRLRLRRPMEQTSTSMERQFRFEAMSIACGPNRSALPLRRPFFECGRRVRT